MQCVKDVRNVAKHGISLAMAGKLEWDVALVQVDARRDYGERRMRGLVPSAGVLYVVTFVERGPVCRVISLRRANRREVRFYVYSAQEEDFD